MKIFSDETLAHYGLEYNEEKDLAHYGTSGMHWGIVRQKAAAGNKGAQRKLAKADENWRKELHSTKAFVNIHNKMAQRMNGKMTADFNSNPKYKGIADFRNMNDPKVKAYYADYNKLADKIFREEAVKMYGESPSGAQSFTTVVNANGEVYAAIVNNEAKHAVEEEIRMYYQYNQNGSISGFDDPVTESITHSEMSIDDALAHYGTRGMHWGIRKNRHASYTDSQVQRDVQVYGKRGSTRINKSLNSGNSISVARGDEKTRRDRVTSKNKYVRQGGKIAGAATGVLAANVGLTYLSRAARTGVGRRIITAIVGNEAGNAAALTIGALSSNPAVRVVASAGAAKIGEMMSGDIAVSTNLRIHGYDPDRKY